MSSVPGHGTGLPAVHFDAGTELLPEGQTTGRLYILLEGEVEVLRGDTRVMVANRPGAIFGEMSLLLDVPHTATVKTLSAASMYEIEDGAAFLEAHPEIALAIAKLLAQRLNAATTYLVDLKRQFEGEGNHLAMVGDVLESLIHQQTDEFTPEPDRPDDPRL
jgi:CRP/FNR family transcriptional regulator, cyclic AMP receptor protein